MRKIFVFWIIFLIVLAAGIILAISSRSTLKREEKQAEELRKAILSRPSLFPKKPLASEPKIEKEKVRVEAPPQTSGEVPKQATETAPAEPTPATSGEIPPLENNIPVEINTDSLEISVPATQSSNPAPVGESEANQVALPSQ